MYVSTYQCSPKGKITIAWATLLCQQPRLHFLFPRECPYPHAAGGEGQRVINQSTHTSKSILSYSVNKE